jgi:hypothetical protein
MLLKARRCEVVLLMMQGLHCLRRHRKFHSCYRLDSLHIPASRWFGNGVERFGPALSTVDMAFHQNISNRLPGLDKNNAKDNSPSWRLAYRNWGRDIDSWFHPVAPYDHLSFSNRALPCMAGQQHSHDHPNDIEILSTTPPPSA